MAAPSCAGCRYYVDMQRPVGGCRRFPPDTKGNLAATTPSNWCGEFAPRIQYGDGRMLNVPPKGIEEDRK